MFDFVSKHKRLLMFVLMIAIVPPFAVWGIQSYQSAGGSPNDVANVEGQKISERDFGEQLRQQQDRLQQLLGSNFDASKFNTPANRARILSGMIDRRVLLLEALRQNLTVTNDQLRDVIASNPAFQDGDTFSRKRYEEVLGREGYTPVAFEASLRQDLILQQYSNALIDSGIASKTISERLAAARAQQRDVAEYKLSAEPFEKQVTIDAKAARAYYNANPAKFLVPEQVRVKYVVLDSNALAAKEPVSEKEVKAWYEGHLKRFQQPEERRASHILIAVKRGATKAEVAKAREKAQSILDKLRKAPDTFAALAKKYSDDPGSAAKGGDLGYFSRNMMVKPFADAVFSLKLHQTSGLVKTQFGFHIIRVTGIKPAKTISFDKVRPEIEHQLKEQRAARKYAEAAETFSNMVYEQPDTFGPVAKKYGLTVQTSGWITRKAAKEKVLNNKRVLAAMFADDALKAHHNTEAIEVSPGTLVSARVIEHHAAATRPFAEVQAEIVHQLTLEKATVLARKQGTEKLDALKKGDTDAVHFGAARMISRDDPKGMDERALSAVFGVDRKKLPAYAGIAVPDGYMLLRVSKVVDVKVGNTALQNLQTELARASGTQELQAFLTDLRSKAKISINKKLLEKATPY